MPTCNRLDLQTLGSQPVIMPENLPGHCLGPPLECLVAEPGKFLGIIEAVKIRVILNPTGCYMLTSSGIDAFIQSRYIRS